MSDEHQIRADNAVQLTAEIISAYVSNNNVPVAKLSNLIEKIHRALLALNGASQGETVKSTKATPAQIRKSMSQDALISFEDGKSYQTLRRHLTLRGFTPEEYRAKWGLPADYPMTAPSYSAKRSALARSLGLGHQRRKTAAPTVPVVNLRRGRPKKTAL